MCTTCGCSDNTKATVTDLAGGATVSVTTHDQPPAPERGEHRYHAHTHHAHDHMGGHSHHEHEHHTHAHAHDHVHTPVAIVSLEEDILAKNNWLAERNRGWFAGRAILALNLVSSPGSGKTTLLERTLRDLGGELPIQVIEGDQATLRDAERIRATGCKVVQINTGAGCHLEADMLAQGVKTLDPPPRSLLMIENVGNLVCPALFDLGERAKVVILSVTEGDDKPVKYPHMFRAAEIMLLNKIDLLPYVNFNLQHCIAYARQVNPRLRIFPLSATTGEGMQHWYDWLRSECKADCNEARA